MNAQTEGIWLGFTAQGERLGLGVEDARKGLAILGLGAEELALLTACSMNEAGFKPVYLDLTGRGTAELSGYMRTLEAASLMRDLLRIDEGEPQYHAKVLSSAISTVLNLPPSEESILDSALTSIASEGGGYASPSAIFDAGSMVAGHRATDKQDLEGRLSALEPLTMSGDEGTLESVQGGVIGFGSLPPGAVDVAAAFALSRLLALARRGHAGFDSIVLTDVHRVFRARRYPDHSRRFQDALMSSGIGKVLSTEFEEELDERVSGGCAVRMISSSVWNKDGNRKLLAGMFVMQDVRQGSSVSFSPRRFEPKGGRVEPVPPPREVPVALTREILRTVGLDSLTTRDSLATWLSVQYGRSAVLEEIDRLIREHFVVPMRPEKDSKNAPVVLTLTLLGREEAKRLEKDGETGDPV